MASRSKVFLTASGAVVIALIAILYVVIYQSEVVRFGQQVRRMNRLLESIASHRPTDVSIRSWDSAVGWARTATANVCFSPNLVSMHEMTTFVDELDARVTRDIDLSTIEWIWERLRKSGPHGSRYVSKWYPEYRRELEYWQQQSSERESN